MTITELLYFEFLVGFGLTVGVTLFYGIVAPWYKQSAGRYIFGLLLSLSIVMLNTVLRIYIPALNKAQWLSAALFGLYILSIAAIGVGVYKAQITRYRRKKFIQDEKDRHRQL